jgi:uncharacterized protein YdeI (YjbR/CyaY-like superfamily)
MELQRTATVADRHSKSKRRPGLTRALLDGAPLGRALLLALDYLMNRAHRAWLLVRDLACRPLGARGFYDAMSEQNPKVDAFLGRAKAWRGEMQKLRSILLESGLDEDLKWGKPCFSFEGSNVAIIQPFKEHCSVMFFKGALLEDRHGLLRSQGENTQSALRLEFTSEAQVKKSILKDYVKQAILVEKAGLKVDFKAKRELELPEELTQMLKKDKKLEKAFNALTPGRQRAYVLHFTAAKQSQTRTARIEKCVPKILAGLGINDR